MLLHDSFFFTLQRYINTTHSSPITIAHSPLFHSSITLFISVFGACSNFICILYLSSIISKDKPENLENDKVEQKQFLHILSNKKYRFLLILTSNDFLLCLSSILSCVDEKYYFQALVARLHLCSFHILIWKFTLHFIPLLIIFVLFRYHYILHRRFPSKIYATTTFNQLFFTDLCILIPFVIALAWSVDGLWLWGVSNIENFVMSMPIYNDPDGPKESLFVLAMNKSFQKSYAKLEEYYSGLAYLPQQGKICYLQINNNLKFTERLLHLIEANYLLLFSLHFIGFVLEIILHVRLSCCLIARKVSTSFIREQQLSLYILYILMCLTLTSLPFYFYRTLEIVFDTILPPDPYNVFTSRALAQINLSGISFKPILYLILLVPSKIVFKFKFYTTIKIESINQLQNVLLLKNQPERNAKRSGRDRYSLRFSALYPKLHVKLRSMSQPAVPVKNRQSAVIELNQNIPIDDFV